MKKTLHLLVAITMLSVLATTSFGQIFMDGDATDWDALPVLVEAPDNQDGMFPPEVGAAVSDEVDIKEVKSVVIGNVLFCYLKFWGSPAWPLQAYENDHEGTLYYETRGYYHIMLDLDNDVTTGWSSDWYEAHYTPLGYLISQGVEYEPIGIEVMTEWGARTNDDWKQENEGAPAIRNLDYWAADYEEYDGQTDNGSDYEIFNMAIPNADSARMMMWQGSLIIDSSDDEAMYDSLKSYWNGHAWGADFLEFAFELTPYQMYYKNKDGRDVLQPGDVVGICGMTETPVDDWGVDMTSRGEITLPEEMTFRPEVISFDGDESDWAAVPVLIEAPDNQDGMFPPEVGAAVSDEVDIKEVRAFIQDDNVYFHLRFWGSPAWPLKAYENDHEGTLYYETRGYYHILMDIDNDVTTGWSTDWYEAHYTPLGYLISQGVEYEPIGAEVMLEWGARTNDDWKQENEGAPAIRNLDYWAADYEEYDGQTDNGSDYEIFNFEIVEKDTTVMMHHDGMLLNNSSDDEATMDGNPDWMAHAWGPDFLENGQALRTIKMYYKNKDGRDVLKTGDVIAICGMTETPVDDWGVDMTTRGTITVNEPVSVEKNNIGVVEKFSLSNNYPNPFNPSTKIQYSIPTSEFVTVKVFDVIGREVAELVNKQQAAGTYDLEFNASHLTSGVYFYKMEAGSFTNIKKMMLIK